MAKEKEVVLRKKVSAEVPVAERIIEFGKDDFTEKEPLGYYPDVTQEKINEFAESALVLSDGMDILQYAKEYPIVVYQCDESPCYNDILPQPRLNCFVERIVVSIGVEGVRYSVLSGELTGELTGFDAVAYYEDPYGDRHHIIQYDILKFLLKKPNLVVSEEGILVFYTEDEILATADCQQYAWVDSRSTRLSDLDGIYEESEREAINSVFAKCTSIESITADKESCKVTLVEGEDKFDAFGAITEKAPRYVLGLNFILKVAARNMITPKFSKL